VKGLETGNRAQWRKSHPFADVMPHCKADGFSLTLMDVEVKLNTVSEGDAKTRCFSLKRVLQGEPVVEGKRKMSRRNHTP